MANQSSSFRRVCPDRRRHEDLLPLIGVVFGDLEIVDVKFNRGGIIICTCECECTTDIDISLDALNAGKTTACRDCMLEKRQKAKGELVSREEIEFLKAKIKADGLEAENRGDRQRYKN